MIYDVHGDVISNEQKGVVEVTRQEIVMLSWLQEFAYKHQLNVFCKRCEKPIRGQNNDNPNVAKLSVECQCREFRYIRGA